MTLTTTFDFGWLLWAAGVAAVVAAVRGLVQFGIREYFRAKREYLRNMITHEDKE